MGIFEEKKSETIPNIKQEVEVKNPLENIIPYNLKRILQNSLNLMGGSLTKESLLATLHLSNTELNTILSYVKSKCLEAKKPGSDTFSGFKLQGVFINSSWAMKFS